MKHHLPLRSGPGFVKTRRPSLLAAISAFWLVPMVLAILTFSAAAFGQTTGTVTGTVKDTSDAVIPDAKVTLINEASKATRTATSNGVGFFSFNAVQPAMYTVSVTRKGYKTSSVTGIELHPGDNLSVDKLIMSVGEILQQVTVTAETAGVSLSSPEHSSLITAADIERLSTVGRDAGELVSILPGFTLNAGTSVQNGGPDYSVTSFGGSLGAYGGNGSAPQQGQVSVVSDGAQIIDPGDMGATVANINMDQVQEVKVQTSNFGADEAKGPIVINAVGKSGGASYHGSLYTYARNYVLNSNDWLSNDQGVARTPAKYLYPGGTIGGPVKIPGTGFNRNKRLTFWAGFEYYDQTSNINGSTAGPLFAFIPTPRMLSGDLSEDSLSAALNVPAADLKANCTQSYSDTAAYTNIGGNCYSPGSNGASLVDQNGVPVNNGMLNTINPAVSTFTKFYPTINRVPQAANGYASDGYNYVKNILATNNGFQFHSRVDQNFSDSLKLYGTYNWEKVNSEQPLNNIYYNPPNTVPFFTPLFSNGYSDYLTLNLTKIVNNTTTNELIGSGVYFDQPEQFGNRAAALDTGTPWAAAGYSGGALKNGVTQLPRIYSYENNGIPNFSFGYVPPGGQYLKKSSYNITDNITKVFHTHTIKAGVYDEQTRNNQVTLGSQANGEITFSRYSGCTINQSAPVVNPTTGAVITPPNFSLGNTTATFLAGCTAGYTQDSFDPSIDMYFNSLEFYATDEWKVTPKLTLTYGIRISHLPPWTDSHGIGGAVWDPTAYNTVTPHVLATNATEDSSTWPGISWHAVNKSIPVAGVPTRLLFYAPRVGLAYDMYGNGKSVFRGGFGVYRSRDSYNVTSAAVDTAVDLVHHTILSNANSNCTLDQLFNAPPIATAPSGSQVLTCGYYSGIASFQSGALPITGSGGIGTIAADNPKDDQQPVTYNYNFTLDQQLPYGISMEVAYVGNQSTDLVTLGNLQNQNVIPLGAFFAPDPIVGQSSSGQTFPASNVPNAYVNDYRPYPNYQQVLVPQHTNWANYNAMQVSLNKQRGSLVFGVNYTWSKSMGVRGNYDTGNIGDPVNPHHDYGVVSFDRPQAMNFTYSYQEGKKFHGNRELGWFLNNWELSGKTAIQSGPDFAILNGSTNFGFSAGVTYYTGTTAVSIPANAGQYLGSTDYTLQPTVTCDPRSNLHTQILAGATRPSHEFVNGACFGLPAQGTQGWWNLPDVHGPAYFNSDLSIYKDIQISERQSLQFRMAGFNFLNHPITSFTNNNLSALGLTFSDGACTDPATGAGNCYYSESAAFAGLKESNAGFGFTSYKVGARIVEFGLKYAF